jgi:predicted dehydrogenase
MWQPRRVVITEGSAYHTGDTVAYERFLAGVRSGKKGEPDFSRGAEIQKILDACVMSDKTGRAVRV